MPITINGTGPIDGVTSLNTSVSSTELGYLDGVTSALQSQINTRAPLSSPTFSGTPDLPLSTTLAGTQMITSGTWTPNISGNNGTGNFSTKQGFYYKIGRMVFITFVVDGGSSNAGGSTQYLTGLPFTISNDHVNTTTVGNMGTNGPATRSQQLMTLSVNRGLLYIFVGGSQEHTAITFASGFAVYLAA